MSQTTRCPSCGTLFKVVADQLRISDGWVRCGQCQQVFDAASHLQEAAKAPLLPEMALDRLRPPPAPVRRPEPPVRMWGEGEAETPRAPTPVSPQPAPVVPAPAAVPPVPPSPITLPPESVAPAVLHVPEPTVPAFLVASQDRAAKATEPPAPAAADTAPLPSLNEAMEWPRIELPPAAPLSPAVPAPLTPASAPAPEPIPEAGYELPSPPLDALDALDGSDPAPLAEEPPAFEETRPLEAAFLNGEGYLALTRPSPALDLVPKEGVLADRAPRRSPLPDDPLDLPVRPKRSAPSDAPVPPQQAEASEEPAPSSSVPPSPEPKKRPRPPEPSDEDATQAEPSFLRAARRKAFWRRPGVRAVLVLLALSLGAALAAQVAVQERSFLAAKFPPLRPGLVALCEPLGCKLEPYRHIASVEVDSSAFQKIRGEEYRLSLSLKNRAALPVAMPAIELTLTDAIDQPVLRRVFLPAQWAAPAELAAHGEWAVVRTVSLADAPARVAGYRVVAFYP